MSRVYRSWKHEFDAKYRQAGDTSVIRIIDNANIILTKAIEHLDDMMACEGYKSGRYVRGTEKGVWNPKTNKCVNPKQFLGRADKIRRVKIPKSHDVDMKIIYRDI
ncbi:MAG: hypothetical protein IMZ52_10680 [Actinobacteria bacterium]|nr:hypothetical protein [Bacteroidota bacterium]MBE3095485.1 hypothetical protein [Actinomycetota bacterium]